MYIYMYISIYCLLMTYKPLGQVPQMLERLSLDVPNDTHLTVLRAPVLQLLKEFGVT